MKKIVSVLIVLALAIGMFACGAETGDPKTTAAPSAGAFTNDDIYVMVNDVKITVGGNQTDFLAALEGAGVTYTSKDEASSCMFGSTGGKDITYHFECGDAFTFPQAADVDNTVDEFFFYTDNCKLKGGITVGATKEDIVAVFGEGYYMIGETMVYNSEADPEKDASLPKISFMFEDGVVSSVDICANLYHV